MEDEFITDRDLEAGFERARRAFEDDTTISDRNKELVGRFLRDAALGKTLIGRAKKKIGPSRRTSYLNHLLPLIRFLNMDLDQVTEPDMERFIEALDRDRIHSRTRLCRGGRRTYTFERPYSARYKVDIKVTIKKFYKWLSGELRTYPKLVEWIDTAEPTKHVPALTESEVGQMLDRCTSSRQRALIQVLFDGGFRLGELLNVRLHHVRLRQLDPANPTARCFFIRVPYSKTLPRTVALPMPSSTKWLKQWLEDHPAKPAIQEDGTLTAADTATPLFPFTGNAVRGTLRRIGDITLGKRVYPHLLRHTSATYWSNRLSWFRMCKRFGWSMTSDMPGRYIDREGVDEMAVATEYHQQLQAAQQHAGRQWPDI